MKTFYVYCHTNKINGKRYIGITCQKPEARWRNGNGYKNNYQPVFAKAIEKYGWNNFEHEIILAEVSEAEAKYAEKYLIAIYKTNVKKWKKEALGYNETDGGDGTVGRVASEETRKKMRENGPDKHGTNNPFYGKHHSEEQRELWKNRNGVQVLCIETGKIYPSIAEASRDTGAPVASIGRCLKGINKHAGNLSWKYLGE